MTNFITNRLFGRGEKWLGKAYAKPATSSFDEGGIGRNRFSLSNRAAAVAPAASNDKGNESLDRTYDYYIGTSVLPSASTSKSLFHNYAPHCPAWWSPMSLIWRGMVDELRVVPLDSGNARDDERAILLGMGYFSWSGGVMNMAPFCLVARPLTCASERLNEE